MNSFVAIAKGDAERVEQAIFVSPFVQIFTPSSGRLVFLRPLSKSRGQRQRAAIPISYPHRVSVKQQQGSDKEIMKDKLPETSREKQKLFSRIRRLGGQITAVERAVSEGDECADILMLLAAIRGGVNSLMAEILEDHIRLHVTHPNRGTDSPEELTEDLISLVRAYLK